MMDGNGVWRVIRQMDKFKEIEHVRSIQNIESVRPLNKMETPRL